MNYGAESALTKHSASGFGWKWLTKEECYHVKDERYVLHIVSKAQESKRNKINLVEKSNQIVSKAVRIAFA